MHFGANKNIILFGASGYLGFEISKYFRVKSFNVYEIQRTQLKKKFLIENLPLEKYATIKALIIAAGPDRVQCENNFDDAKSNNSELINSVYSIASSYNIEKFIFLSSIHVYGETLTGSICEKSKPDPYDRYSELKIESEFRLSKLALVTKASIFNIRLSNVFGFSGTNNKNWKDLVLNFLFLSVVKGSAIKLKKTENVYRNFLYIERFSNFFDYLVSLENKDRTQSQIINLGGTTLFLEEAKSFLEEYKINGRLQNVNFWKTHLQKKERPFIYRSQFLESHGKSFNNIFDDFVRNYSNLKQLHMQNII